MDCNYLAVLGLHDELLLPAVYWIMSQLLGWIFIGLKSDSDFKSHLEECENGCKKVTVYVALFNSKISVKVKVS